MAANRGWLAKLLRDPPDDETERFVALHAVWFPEPPAGAVTPPPRDAHFRGPSELAVFRSEWDDPDGLWVGFNPTSATRARKHDFSALRAAQVIAGQAAGFPERV